MKCPECDGYGKVGKYNYYGTCPQCGGTGEMETETTNEEWFASLPTEEKAKFLRKIYRDGRDDYVGEWYEQTESDFIEWLKQPHHEKE